MSIERQLIAIAGPTCSGKTTLANKIVRQLGEQSQTICYDDYDKYPNGSSEFQQLLQNGTVNHWEDPALYDNQAFITDLVHLKQGLPITLNSYSRESIKAGFTARTVNPQKYNVIEGILILHLASARALFDHSFYLDLPFDEIIRRRMSRTPKDSLDPWDSFDYLIGRMIDGTKEFVLPQREYAELVLNGLDSTEKLVQQVLSQL